PSSGARKHQNRPRRRVCFRAGWKLAVEPRLPRGLQTRGPAAVSGNRREHELDGLRRGVEHDVERNVGLLDRPEDIGPEPSFRKIPILLRHLGRVRGQPQHAEGAVGTPAFDPTAGTQLRESAAQFGELAYQRAHVVFCVTQRGPIYPSARIVLTVSIVVSALTGSDLVSLQ